MLYTYRRYGRYNLKRKIETTRFVLFRLFNMQIFDKSFFDTPTSTTKCITSKSPTNRYDSFD